MSLPGHRAICSTVTGIWELTGCKTIPPHRCSCDLAGEFCQVAGTDNRGLTLKSGRQVQDACAGAMRRNEALRPLVRVSRVGQAQSCDSPIGNRKKGLLAETRNPTKGRWNGTCVWPIPSIPTPGAKFDYRWWLD